jgi:hypothetical protein
MRFRKLQIAWSLGCGIACVLLIVLWAQSYFDRREMPAYTERNSPTASDRPAVSSHQRPCGHPVQFPPARRKATFRMVAINYVDRRIHTMLDCGSKPQMRHVEAFVRRFARAVRQLFDISKLYTPIEGLNRRPIAMRAELNL